MTNISCEQFACVVCGFCNKKPGNKPGESNKPLGKKTGSKGKDRGLGDMQQIADASIVFVLGTLDGVKQLDVYSGNNGYHMHTIPGRRWKNPVKIGAGSGLLAVVDSFQDNDIIRVTDKYAGAGKDAFDANGQPKDEINWEEVKDICQIPTESGCRVKGLTILSQGILIATIDDGSGVGKFLRADVFGRMNNKPNEAFEGIVQMWPDAVNCYGPLNGSPVAKETDIHEDIFCFLALAEGDEGASCSIIDCRNGKVHAMLAMPKGLMGVAYSNNTVTVATGEDGVVKTLYRFIIEKDTFLMTGAISVKNCPEPEEYTVSVMPAYQDFKSEVGEIHANIRKYWNIATTVNEGRLGPERVMPNEVNLRKLKEPKSATELNDNRKSVIGEIKSNAYGGASIPITEISCPDGLRLVGITSNFGVIAELFQRVDNEGQPSVTQPLFRLIHGDNYDFLLDGGWTYGSLDKETKEEYAITNGLVGLDIAIDKDYDFGKLKGVDLKVAMIDDLTGLMVFRTPKPLGKYKLYSGKYAGLKPYDPTGKTIKRTQASNELDAIATEFDGIARPERMAKRNPETLEPGGDMYPVAAFENDEDCDEAWALFMRRVQAPQKVTVTPCELEWNMREPDPVGMGLGAWWTEYRDLKSPMKVSGQEAMHYPPRSHNTNPTKFQYSAGGGYFVPNWPMENTTDFAVWEEQIADLQEENARLAQTAGNEAKIAANNAQIEQLRQRMSGTDPDTGEPRKPSLVVRVPSSVIKHQFSGLELSPGQMFDTEKGTYDKEQMRGKKVSPWEVTTIGEDDKKKRAVAFTSDCRTWIIIDVKLDRGGVITDGVSSWTQPAARTNGLGVPVGAFDYESMHPGYAQVFKIVGGSIYESGYRSYWDMGGAEGRWTLDIEIDGTDYRVLQKQGRLHKPTYWEIYYRAPLEMQRYLLEMYTLGIGEMVGVTPGRGWHPIRIFYMKEPIKSITVTAKLWNDAFDVFRVGWRTIDIDDDGGNPICPKADPGYRAGDNCEGAACGNLTCGSAMFGTRNKLYSTDPTYPVTTQLVWEGRATYTWIDDCPYEKRGILMGKLWDCYMDFDLNNPMNAFAVDIRP